MKRYGMTKWSNYTDEFEVQNNCNCLPSCVTLDYEVELSQSEWDWREMIKNVKKTKRFADIFDETDEIGTER